MINVAVLGLQQPLQKEFYYYHDEDLFLEDWTKKRFDIVIFHLSYLQTIVDLQKVYDFYRIAVYEHLDYYIYKKVLQYADFVYDFYELWKIPLRVQKLNTQITKLKSNIFQYNDLLFNAETEQLYKDKKPIKLSPGEKELLKLLIKNRDRVLSKVEIVEESETISSLESIKVFVSRLRSLGFEIQNHKNQGYQLKETT
ncbi:MULTISPECIES: winged helix-turn-helix domain-containing protein [unclassified Nitratiruptor]|uniref:winged helix-turn-helix domain-containing protein n=1 Tax=unclassified Nitratiruptor TaxID=2624044 RepID=UPI0019169177|nr:MULTISPECIES: winged helix-turn-helix domain-containing protein [unclassified Nitratiruptor]BCD59796.1 hypothetical protein NitYY0810_C0553 [Nitratiruptor sp. YY08-10]BCD63720.1 hypothetical protein NitYY0814_C0553 [Nitratiruptor sp. YY08-14]